MGPQRIKKDRRPLEAKVAGEEAWTQEMMSTVMDFEEKAPDVAPKKKLSKRDRKAEKRKHLQWESNKENNGDAATTDTGNEPKAGKKKKGKKRTAATEGHVEASAKTDASEKAVTAKKKGK